MAPQTCNASCITTTLTFLFNFFFSARRCCHWTHQTLITANLTLTVKPAKNVPWSGKVLQQYMEVHHTDDKWKNQKIVLLLYNISLNVPWPRTTTHGAKIVVPLPWLWICAGLWVKKPSHTLKPLCKQQFLGHFVLLTYFLEIQ